MQRIERDISREQYEALLQMDTKQVNDFIEIIACHSNFPPAGYGFYCPDFHCNGSKYSVSWLCGNSCD